MKTFKVFTLHMEYVVLKCPECSHTFRYDYRRVRFGNVVSNAKCQRCDKMFDMEKHCLQEDSLARNWEGKEHILRYPDGHEEHVAKKEETKLVPSANTLFETPKS